MDLRWSESWFPNPVSPKAAWTEMATLRHRCRTCQRQRAIQRSLEPRGEEKNGVLCNYQGTGLGSEQLVYRPPTLTHRRKDKSKKSFSSMILSSLSKSSISKCLLQGNSVDSSWVHQSQCLIMTRGRTLPQILNSKKPSLCCHKGFWGIQATFFPKIFEKRTLTWQILIRPAGW